MVSARPTRQKHLLSIRGIEWLKAHMRHAASPWGGDKPPAEFDHLLGDLAIPALAMAPDGIVLNLNGAMASALGRSRDACVSAAAG